MDKTAFLLDFFDFCELKETRQKTLWDFEGGFFPPYTYPETMFEGATEGSSF